MNNKYTKVGDTIRVPQAGTRRWHVYQVTAVYLGVVDQEAVVELITLDRERNAMGLRQIVPLAILDALAGVGWDDPEEPKS